MRIEDIVRKEFTAADAAISGLLSSECYPKTMEAIIMMRSACKNGHELSFAGNGGSALDANHLALELVGEHREGRVQRRAISLSADPSIILAIGNDVGFDYVFSHQLKGRGRPGDVFMGISTSGKSRNVIFALKTAKELGLGTVALIGGDGGEAKDLADIAIIVPASTAPSSQNLHRVIYHAMWECLVLPDSSVE